MRDDTQEASWTRWVNKVQAPGGATAPERAKEVASVASLKAHGGGIRHVTGQKSAQVVVARQEVLAKGRTWKDKEES